MKRVKWTRRIRHGHGPYSIIRKYIKNLNHCRTGHLSTSTGTLLTLEDLVARIRQAPHTYFSVRVICIPSCKAVSSVRIRKLSVSTSSHAQQHICGGHSKRFSHNPPHGTLVWHNFSYIHPILIEQNQKNKAHLTLSEGRFSAARLPIVFKLCNFEAGNRWAPAKKLLAIFWGGKLPP